MNKESNALVSPRPWLLRAVMLAAADGIIHMGLIPGYFQEWLGYGAFFFGAAALLLLYAMLLAVSRPDRGLYVAGIVGSVVIITLYIITRTVGIPFFGPDAGEVQPVGVPDAISKLIELALIGHLAVLLQRLPRFERWPLVD